jgi:alpha-ribazole phosphatase
MRTLIATSAMNDPALLHAWRHPRAPGAEGRCIGGRTELRVDPRRAKRLAHRIRAFARQHGLPRLVVTSPLQRSRAVGRWLARWGWHHRIDAALGELDFGRWDGQPWTAVPRAEFDAWCADFERQAPGGGETVAALLQRVRGFDPGAARIVVTHGGWLSAALWLVQGAGAPPRSPSWPAAPRHGTRTALPRPPAPPLPPCGRGWG